jgi:hypothetical protein
MTETVLSGKKCSLKKCLLTAGLLAILCLPAGAERKGTFGFGIQAGAALGFKPQFGLHSIKNVNPQPFIYGLRLYHNFSGHIQCNFSDRFGLRFELAYQNGTYMKPRLNHQTDQWGLVTVGSSFSYYTLDGVYSFPERKNMGFFILAGAGSGSGDDWIHGPDGFMVFRGGAGVNIYLIRNSGWALIPGLVFHHLYDPASNYRSSTIHGTWIRLNIGVAYAPRARAGL